MKKRLCISVLLMLVLTVGFCQVTVAFRLPYEYTKADSALNEFREVLKQQKISEVRGHANYRIYINRPLVRSFEKFGYKIKVEKGNITVDALNDAELINGIIDITEQIKKTHSLARIKSKFSNPKIKSNE